MVARPSAAGISGAVAVSLMAMPARVGAEPYLAIRTGLKCSACHVNVTGGGGRNLFGANWGQTALPARVAQVRNRALTDWLAVGFDVRAAASVLVTEADPRGTFEITEAQLQLEAQLLERLVLYVDQTLGPDRALAREVFLLARVLPAAGYLKAGKMLLPYGWRIWDDAAYIRSETGFTYLTPDVGVEVGIEPGPLSWTLAVSNGSFSGTDGNSGKMVTSSVVLVQPAFRVGASASHNAGAGTDKNVVGAFAGARVRTLALLGEVDLIRNTSVGGSRDQLVAYGEGSLLVAPGLNVKASYSYHDPYHGQQGVSGQRVRGRFGLEYFPVQFLHLSLFYIMPIDVPQVTTDRDVVSVEGHVFF